METFSPRLFFIFRVTESFDMPKYTMVIATLLIDLGILFFLISSVQDGNLASPTALIPAVIGLPILIMSFLAKKMPRRRSLFMHISVILAIVCLLGGAMGVQSLMKGDLSLSTIEQLILLTLAIDYTINSSKSFIHARKQRAKCDTDKR